MKIAVTFSGCHRRGGVERVVFECVRHLAAKGHQVDVFAHDYETDTSPAIQYIRVPMTERPGFLGPWSFYRHCTEMLDPSKYDAVSTHGCVSPGGGVQWVHSVHKAWLEHSAKFRGAWSAGRIKQRLNPLHPILLHLEAGHFNNRRYRRVIAMTPTVKADLHRFYGVPDADVEIVPNGFSPTEFNLDRVNELRDAVRKELGYAESDRVIVFVANELERKGFGPLVRAMAELKDKNLRLLVVGRVSPDAHAAEIEKRGLTPFIRFVGPSRDVARYYAAADVFALPTQYEAWGLVIVEAMACGLPVLTSRLAGAAITVSEGVSGLLLEDPANVDEIRTKLDAIVSGGMAGREAIAKSVAMYQWPNVLNRYESLLLANRN
jgi:UDP-glucose:(heptosyl)LPS alpha-1,3-glucosyltransferase